MDLFTAIETRRSIKHYDPQHQMSEEEIEKLFSHVILSPTSFNIQNWRFVIVQNPELKAQIRAVSWDQAQVTDASIVVLLCADLKAWAKDTQRYWINTPEAVQQQIVPMIGQFYQGKELLQRDEAMRSCGIAGQTLMLTAKAMGYDTCPMIGFDPVAVAKIINLPEDHVISFMITVGKPLKPARPRSGQLPLTEVIVRDSFK
ncbi:MAG: nitroreductase family protein [Gloeocapsa sp. DLM2.Bin57]|nr:MAG: nitroreductase family protein [Gloeocapsa sp. DLM2.Bin57]